MPQVISFTRRRSAAHSRSVRVRHPKENALSQGGTGQGIHQQTQPECSDDASLGTEEASEARISELRTAMDAAARSADLATFKILKAEWEAARALRSPVVLDRLNAEHLANTERIRLLNEHGYWLVPRSASPVENRQGIAFEDVEFVDASADEAGARRSA